MAFFNVNINYIWYLVRPLATLPEPLLFSLCAVYTTLFSKDGSTSKFLCKCFFCYCFYQWYDQILEIAKNEEFMKEQSYLLTNDSFIFMFVKYDNPPNQKQ